MKTNSLTALSPLDGRYYLGVCDLREYFSEFALMRARVKVEVEWLIHLSKTDGVDELPEFSDADKEFLRNMHVNFSMRNAERIKAIDNKINHDVKAVEYFVREKMSGRQSLASYREFVHFGCTSDDINNLAYALLLSSVQERVILPMMYDFIFLLKGMVNEYSSQPMLARTHGQPASPTTVGKEIAVFWNRIAMAKDSFEGTPILAKFNGASGNFNAHLAAYPKINWDIVAQNFVYSFGGIGYRTTTTQIEPKDYIASYCDALSRFNTVVLDLNRDMWGYISLGYFNRKPSQDEVGSSVMPHKVNPIAFENSEGNIGVANALLKHFSEKLPVSRWQRDLSDSTVMRNLGVAIGHSILACKSTKKGLSQVEVDEKRLRDDLNANWKVMAEAVQTVMRRYGIKNSYEQVKELVNGECTIDQFRDFISSLDIPDEAKKSLMEMSPENYIGYAGNSGSFF